MAAGDHREPVPGVRSLATAGRPRNAVPESKPYTYRGDLGNAETRARLAELRARLDCEWLTSQARPAIEDTGQPPSAEQQRAALATSREARAAVPAPTIIQGSVIREPVAVEPPPITPVKAARRCRGCGYLRTRCTCPGRRPNR
jgi:hypothetical protein